MARKFREIMKFANETILLYQSASSALELANARIRARGDVPFKPIKDSIDILQISVKNDIDDLSSVFPNIINKRGDENLYEWEKRFNGWADRFLMSYLKTNRYFQKRGINLDSVIEKWKDVRSRTIRLNRLIAIFPVKCQLDTGKANKRNAKQMTPVLSAEIDRLLSIPLETGASTMFTQSTCGIWIKNWEDSRRQAIASNITKPVLVANALEMLVTRIKLSRELAMLVADAEKQLSQMSYWYEFIAKGTSREIDLQDLDKGLLSRHSAEVHRHWMSLNRVSDVIGPWSFGVTNIPVLKQVFAYLDNNYEDFKTSVTMIVYGRINWDFYPVAMFKAEPFIPLPPSEDDDLGFASLPLDAPIAKPDQTTNVKYRRYAKFEDTHTS